jgi:hypothetical protein
MALRRISLTLGPALTALALYAAASAASAASARADPTPAGTVAVGRACYVNTAKALAQITVSGGGWEAGSTIELTDELGRIAATATAGPSGTFSAAVPAPVVDPYAGPQVSDTIKAAYEAAPGLPSDTGASASSTPFLTTNYAVIQTGNKTNPNRRTIYELSGFRPGRAVYAHYLTAAGTWLANASFGKPAGACGLRRVETYEYPGRHPKRGSYTIQFDNSAKYRSLTQPQYRLAFQIRTV